MKKSLWIILLACYSCITNDESRNNPGSTLPGRMHVEAIFKKNISDWKLVEKEDYDPLWWSFYDRELDPTFAELDINDDKKVDYIFFGKNEREIKLFFYISNATEYELFTANDFSVKITDDYEGFEYGLTPEPPGRIDVVLPKIQSLILNYNAVNLMEYEVRNRIYYFANNTVESFKTK